MEISSVDGFPIAAPKSLISYVDVNLGMVGNILADNFSWDLFVCSALET